MLSFSSFFFSTGPSELPALLLLAVAIIVQRNAPFDRRKVVVFGLVLLQLALPTLMFVCAALFSHDRGVIVITRSMESCLNYLLFGLYLLQFPVGFLIAFFLTSRIRANRYQVGIASLLAALLIIQMYYSFILMLLASLEISGDSM